MTSKLDNLENVLPNQYDKNENLKTEQNDENLNTTNPSNENLPDLEHVDLPEDPSANDFYSLNPSGSSYQSLPSLVPSFPKPVLKRKKTSLQEVQLERVNSYVRSQEVFTSSPIKRSRVDETLSDCSYDSGDSDITDVNSDNMDKPVYPAIIPTADEMFNEENCNNNHYESETESSGSKFSITSSFTNVSLPENDCEDEEEKPTLKRTNSCESWVHVPSAESVVLPSTSSEQPSTSSGQPSTSSGQPSTSFEQPSTSSGQPSTSFEQPSTSYESTSSSAGEPSFSGNEPSSANVEPSSTGEEPSSNDEEPSSTVKEPISNDEPSSDDAEPISIEEDPSSVEGAVTLVAGPVAGSSKEHENLSVKLDLNLAEFSEAAAAAQIENRYTDNFKESLLEAQCDGSISPCRVSKDTSRNGSCFVSRNASNVVSRLNSGLASPKSPPNSPINAKRNKGPFNDIELLTQLKNLAEGIQKKEDTENDIKESVQLENLTEGVQENQDPVNDNEVFVQVENLAEGAEADQENGEPENVDAEKPVDVEMEIPVEIEVVDDGRVKKPIEEEIRRAVEDEDDDSIVEEEDSIDEEEDSIDEEEDSIDEEEDSIDEEEDSIDEEEDSIDEEEDSIDEDDDSIDENFYDEVAHANRVRDVLANANRARYRFPDHQARTQAVERRIRKNVDRDEENVYYVKNEMDFEERIKPYMEAARERVNKIIIEMKNKEERKRLAAVCEKNARDDALMNKSRGFSFRRARFRGESIFSRFFFTLLEELAFVVGAGLGATLGLVWMKRRLLDDGPETIIPFYVC